MKTHRRTLSRRNLLQSISAMGIGSLAFERALAVQVEQAGKITPEMVAQAEWIAGIELDEEEREDVAESVQGTLASARRLREIPVDADTVPALVFRPDFFYQAAGNSGEPQHDIRGARPAVHVAWSLKGRAAWQRAGTMSDEQLAFASLTDQASMLAAGKISSRELTQLYLTRLERFDPLLRCVVTLLEEPALEQAAASDERRAQGNVLGVLDGIPWVAKDLIAVPPWKTTWGAEPFKDQVREPTATVATKLALT